MEVRTSHTSHERVGKGARSPSLQVAIATRMDQSWTQSTDSLSAWIVCVTSKWFS